MPDSPSFNDLIYALVRAIPPGKVLSYGRVAQLLGVPHGARAVGWALSALKSNQQPEVPWQRVVNAQGQISIKGSPEGALLQRQRLEAEGITFDEYDRIDFTRFLWEPTPPEVDAAVRIVRQSDSSSTNTPSD